MFKQAGLTFENKDDAPHSERFFPIEEVKPNLTIAEALNEHYGEHMCNIKREMAQTLAAAEIGGFYIFDDGSELLI